MVRVKINELEAELSSPTALEDDFQTMSNELRSQLESMGFNQDTSWGNQARGREEQVVYELYPFEALNTISRVAMLGESG